MRIRTIRPTGPPSRRSWHTAVMALLLLAGSFSIVGLALPTAAQASSMAVDQCNGHGPGPEGATTALTCTVTVVNTISATATSSETTVTRLCTLGRCSTPNGSFTTRSTGLVTSVRQCNDSDNDAAHKVECSVKITNNIEQNNANPHRMAKATVNQCVGSGKGGPEGAACTPFPDPTSGAAITQCNGSANGGGGVANCTVDPRSKVNSAVPVTVNQCNGTANVGGSAVNCRVSLISNSIKVTGTDTNDGSREPSPTPTPSASASPSPSARATPAATATKATTAAAAATTAAATPKAISQAPASDAQSSTAPSSSAPTGPYMLGAALVLAGAISALLYRRYASKR